MSGQCPSSQERRSFLTRLNAGAASLAALAVGGAAIAQGKPGPAAQWEPARHDKDDWLDKQATKHRLVFDTTTPEGLAEALAFAGNFIRVNRTDYGLQESDLAVVIIVRFHSTPFGYNDAMWAKYGTAMAAQSRFEDPKSKAAPKANVFESEEYGDLMANRGMTLDALFKQGVQLAVCSVATRAYAGAIAAAVGGNADAINSELIANRVSTSRMVPAGIVAVSRAQERGYTLVRA
jgi:intracellular sulfur oxidation DsrE/DsrF family protein